MSKTEKLIKLIQDTNKQIEKLVAIRKDLAITLANLKETHSIKYECRDHGPFEIELSLTEHIALLIGGESWEEVVEQIDMMCPVCSLEQQEIDRYLDEDYSDQEIICGCGCGQ